jgi:hypothetical protein
MEYWHNECNISNMLIPNCFWIISNISIHKLEKNNSLSAVKLSKLWMKSKYELKFLVNAEYLCILWTSENTNTSEHRNVCFADNTQDTDSAYFKPSYSYTGMESGDSRLFISTKIAQSLLKFLTWITRHLKMASKAAEPTAIPKK